MPLKSFSKLIVASKHWLRMAQRYSTGSGSDLVTLKFTKSLPLPVLYLLLFAALFSIVVFSFEDKQTIVEISDQQSEKIPTDSSLNLHRWGAVTLFHGLPSDRVNAITEDTNGALWFGTDNGLVRYDGRRLEPVGNAGDGRGELPSQRIRSLFRDSSGGLWIGTDLGAVRFIANRLLPVKESANLSVNAVAESPENEIALVTEQGKLLLLHPLDASVKRQGDKFSGELQATIIDSQTQKMLSIENQPVALKSIAYFNHEWWIGSHRRGGLTYKKDQIIEAAPPPTRPYFVNSIIAHNRKIWGGAQGTNGLWIHEENGAGLQAVGAIASVNALYGAEKDLWIGTESNGAFLWKDGSEIEHLTFENTKSGLRSNRVLSIFRDHEGVVWFGTDRGVSRYDRESFRSTTLSNDGQSNFVRSLLTTKNGVTYAGTNRGLFKLNPGLELGGWQRIEAFGNKAIYALLESSDGKIFIGSESGLFQKSEKEDFILLASQSENGKREALSIRALREANGNVYALAHELGVFRIENNSLFPIASLKAYSEAQTFLMASDGKPIFFDKAEAILQVGDKIFVEKNNSLVSIQNGNGTEILKQVEVKSLSLLTDNEGKNPIIYCGTHNKGLYKINLIDGAVSRFDTEQGFPSQQVYCTAGNPDGTVWIGTNRGLVKHHPNFSPPIIEPRRLVADLVYAGDFLTTELRFPYFQKNYLLEVTGLGSKTFPSQFQYEYTLSKEKSGTPKTRISADPIFELKDATPGNYTITVRAISRDLIYSKPYSLKIWISPEGTSTTTILLTALLILAIAAGGYAFFQQRRTQRTNEKLEVTNNELRETRIRLATTTEAERSRIARDLHDQTLGDLRHLLVMTDQLTPQKAANGNPSPAQIRQKIEEISNEVRHICEDLSPSVLENIGFIPSLEWALSDAVMHLPAEEKFVYDFDCNDDLEDRLNLSDTEQIQLYRIVQEAINNICKHANAKKVSLKISAINETNLQIELTDDGTGFHQSEENPTGHGMANIRSRANLIGASVAWNPMDSGCEFQVIKPQAIQNAEARTQ